MTAAPLPSKPSFFWQGLCIVLPVAVLAVACLISLRQDERTAENDAHERAVINAQTLGRALRSSVDEELQRYLTLQNTWALGLHGASQGSASAAFPGAKLQADIENLEHDYPGLSFAELALPPGAILADGRQLEPPDFPPAPQPPDWFRDLSPEQARLWEALRTAATPAQQAAARQAFLNSHPAAGAKQAADILFRPPEETEANSGAVPSETGLAYEEIACYRLLTAPQAQLTGARLQQLWWRVVGHPSVVSPKLLEQAGRLTNNIPAPLREKFGWLQQNINARTRTADSLGPLRTLPDLRPWKKLWWSHWTQDGSALALFRPATYGHADGAEASGPPAEPGYDVWLVPRPVITAIFNRAMAENQSFIPPYAAADLTVETARLYATPNAATGTGQWPLLAGVEQTAGRNFAQDAIRFDVRFFLASRAQMLAAERRRALVFGALVLGAVLTAAAGLWSARRAFRRQLQLNEQKSNFVSSVSHELRAPIASVRLMAENLERGKIPGPDKQREYFRFIVQECRRLSSLIENVLDFSRIEQGRKQYEFESTDLVALVGTTVKLMEPYAAERGVALKCESPAGPPAALHLELNVDGRAIQQALVNLIDNAVKHSPKGETVAIGLEPPPAAGGDNSLVRLYVADHGPGIPAAEHEKIFERFYRLGSELRRETPGVGIGLSVVKHIVAAHGGRVRVESAPG
ncbi:MAG: HAMP domain-containing sensor histidine kinase, partial [Verrucomicrobiae bacterium]|nr:HAMP domain-containing sensor histidine kinase [Verrucomicrobiae bacterium]